MKKVLAIFLVTFLILSIMSNSIMALPAVDTYKTKLFFDFSEEQSFATSTTWVSPDRWAVNGNLFKNPGDTTASVSYDTGNKALKLLGNGAAVVDLDVRALDRRAGMSVNKYTALAMKVKLSDTNAVLQSASMGLHDANTASIPGNLYALNSIPAYASTTDWQLVVIDLRSTNWSQELTDIVAANTTGTPNNWWSAHLNMAQAGYTAPIYVEWIAVFESAEDATNFYNKVPPVLNTAYYFDFSSQAKFTDMTDFGVDGNTDRPRTIVNVNNNNIPVSTYSTVSYDTTNEAMKVTSTDGKAVQLDFQCLDWRTGLDYKTYKTLALKVKLSDASATFMAATIRANDGAASSAANNLHDLTRKPTYTATTDWQLVLIDLDRSNWKQPLLDIEAANNTAGTTSNWWGGRLALAAAGYTGEIYVKWAGIFEDTAKAQIYYDSESRPGNITATMDAGNILVSISDYSATHSYQIWTYQEVTSGVFGTTEKQNQWILSLPYTLGSDSGFTVAGDAITKNIGSFTSASNSYTIAVKVIDGSGNFVGQFKDTYTPAEVGQAVITKVTVDSVFADDKVIVKDIAEDSPVQFAVTGNDVSDKVYTATVDQTNAELTAAGAGLNEFNWDISTLAPGSYSVTLTLTSGASSDSRTVNFKLYDSTVAASSYGVVGGVTTVTPGTETETHYAINIGAADITGALFRYRISEPWGPTVLFSEPIEVTDGTIAQTNNNSILKGKYGIYQVTGYTYRNGVSSADDGFVKTVNYARPGGATLDLDVDEVTAGAGVIEKPTDNDIVIAASSSIPEPVYSFWRRDANGWVMIRGYDAAGTVTWKPHRVGLYTIQVRAKASGGLTYEVLKNIEFNVTKTGEAIAEVTDITINDLSAAAARTPILISANATSTSEDLLYKFIISNGYIYYVETAYSADPTYMWVPGKAGNYTISVLVKNQVSFGKYDGIGSFTVNATN